MPKLTFSRAIIAAVFRQSTESELAVGRGPLFCHLMRHICRMSNIVQNTGNPPSTRQLLLALLLAWGSCGDANQRAADDDAGLRDGAEVRFDASVAAQADGNGAPDGAGSEGSAGCPGCSSSKPPSFCNDLAQAVSFAPATGTCRPGVCDPFVEQRSQCDVCQAGSCAPTLRAAELSVEDTGACALSADRMDVLCWGAGSFVAKPVPELHADAPHRQLVRRGRYLCVLQANRHIRCNAFTADADGAQRQTWHTISDRRYSNMDHVSRSLDPPLRYGRSGVLLRDYGHGCAVDEKGKVWCWGSNEEGQLGDGSTTRSESPKYVEGLDEPVASVVVMDERSCALSVAGQVACWGRNLANGVGLGDDQDGALRPKEIPEITALGDVEQLTLAPPFHGGCLGVCASLNCARRRSGEVWCWGNLNEYDRVLKKNVNLLERPMKMAGLSGAALDIASGAHHFCATIEGGSVECVVPPPYRDEPETTVLVESGAMDIATRGYATCVLLDDGHVMCRDGRDGGVAGFGSHFTIEPTHQTLYGNADELFLGTGNACARFVDGSIRCISAVGREGPEWVSQAHLSGAVQVARTRLITCGLFASGKVACHKTTADEPDMAVVGGDSPRAYQQIAAADYDACGTVAGTGPTAGTVECWTRDTLESPSTVTGIPDEVTQLAAGYTDFCAVTDQGTVFCWNRGTSPNMWVAEQAAEAPPGVAQVAPGGGGFRCALTSANAVSCWGDRVGAGPQQVSGLPGDETITGIVANASAACALLEDGRVGCWGANTLGALGIGSANGEGDDASHSRLRGGPDTTPFAVEAKLIAPLPDDIQAIVAGDGQTCVRTRDARHFCWGRRFYYGGAQMGFVPVAQ